MLLDSDLIVKVMYLSHNKGDQHDYSHDEEESVVHKFIAPEVIRCLLLSRKVPTVPDPYVKLSPTRHWWWLLILCVSHSYVKFIVNINYLN